MCVCFGILLLSRKNNASCYSSTLWAEMKLFHYPMLSLTFLIGQHLFHLFVTLPDVSWNRISLFSAHIVQSVWPHLRVMCGRVVQTWLIGIVHLLDHSDWFSSGMVMWFKLTQWYSTLGVYWTVEEEKLRNSVFTEVAYLCRMNKLKPVGSTI